MVSPDAFAERSAAHAAAGAAGLRARFAVDRGHAARGRGERRARCAAVAPERVFAELKRIVIADRALDGLELMDALGATEVVLPELSRLRGVEQSPYHHLDVYEHTRAVLAETIELEREPRAVASASTREPSRGSWPSRSPTSSPGARRCASGRCCTTSPSRRRAA